MSNNSINCANLFIVFSIHVHVKIASDARQGEFRIDAFVRAAGRCEGEKENRIPGIQPVPGRGLLDARQLA